MESRKHPISTFSRFLYLNSYAFLLLLLGAGVAVVPFYSINWWLAVPQGMVAFFCLKGSLRIFLSWGDKKRKYQVLMERNRAVLRPDTFSDFMQAPCGRLLVRVVLNDLGKAEAYDGLKALEEPMLTRLRKGCQPQETTIYINKEYQP